MGGFLLGYFIGKILISRSNMIQLITNSKRIIKPMVLKIVSIIICEI
jgi:hypothetical protein